MLITSLENKEIKKYYKLKKKKYRDLEKLFLVEGVHLVEEAYRKNLLEKVILLEEEKLNFEVEYINVTSDIMKKISSLDTPPNIIGVCKMKDKEENLGNKVLILDDVQDPGNLGTIIRSSLAFNVDTILLSNNTVDLYNPKVIRSTQGMIFHINIIRCDIKEEINYLKNNGYTIFSTNVKNGKDISSINLKEITKYALIVGNEGNGVSKEVSLLADQNLYIKTNELVESLNVGVATSILLYEMGKNHE